MVSETKLKAKKVQGAHPVPQLVVDPDSVDNASRIYADSLVHMGVGPFISKLTFGSQTPTSRSVAANFTLVLPTNALVGLLAACQQALTPEALANLAALRVDQLRVGQVKVEPAAS